jgi:hypothetical protein
MDISCDVTVPSILHRKDNILQTRRKQWERILMNSLKYTDEVIKMQQLTAGK